MEKDLNLLFKKIAFEPDLSLKDKIFETINLKKKRRARFGIFTYLGSSFAFLTGSIFSFQPLIKGLNSLGFFEYVSLVFSDGSALALIWKDYLLTLVDSLPVASLGLSMFLLFLLFVSIKKVSYQFKSYNLKALA
jgi:hypothetical protein